MKKRTRHSLKERGRGLSHETLKKVRGGDLNSNWEKLNKSLEDVNKRMVELNKQLNDFKKQFD